MDVLRQAIFTGAAPNVSDAYTINGQPGDFYRCSKQGLPPLRILFSPSNEHFFFPSIRCHLVWLMGYESERRDCGVSSTIRRDNSVENH